MRRIFIKATQINAAKTRVFIIFRIIPQILTVTEPIVSLPLASVKQLAVLPPAPMLAAVDEQLGLLVSGDRTLYIGSTVGQSIA